jgi:hypothetical protein
MTTLTVFVAFGVGFMLGLILMAALCAAHDADDR